MAEIPTNCREMTLREGDTGECVTLLQQALKAKNLLMKEVDGNFDGLTKEAVRDLQGPAGLETNGVCDPATWALL